MCSNENIQSVVWLLVVQQLNFQKVGDSDDYYDQDFLAVEIATSILLQFFLYFCKLEPYIRVFIRVITHKKHYNVQNFLIKA